jgi:hypothetical protein
VLHSSCLIFDVAPRTSDASDISEFLAVAWTVHSDLVLVEVSCIIPEPQEPFVERQPPLFLRSSEIVHSKRGMLGFRVFIKIIEIHDFSRQRTLATIPLTHAQTQAAMGCRGQWGPVIFFSDHTSIVSSESRLSPWSHGRHCRRRVEMFPGCLLGSSA